MILKNKERLEFTSDAKGSIESSEIIFIAVGTPQSEDGSCDTSFVTRVAETISECINGRKLIIVKSTVPVGTGKRVEQIIKSKYSGAFAVISNPEFLKEGSAIEDFFRPDRVVIGATDGKAAQEVKNLYEPLKCEFVLTNRESSELIKYASNAFLATKISFINSLANLAEKVGANIKDIEKGMGSDHRIGNQFLKAGLGYGGSCFPKDVKALIHLGRENQQQLEILESVESVNMRQKTIPIKKLKDKIDLKNAKIAVLGLSFKPDTDDIREAPSLEIIQFLLNEQSNVWAWDPIAEPYCQPLFPNVHYCPSPEEALQDADAAVIVTEWEELKKLDLQKIKHLMKEPLIIDGRNILNKNDALKLGIDYLGVGI